MQRESSESSASDQGPVRVYVGATDKQDLAVGVLDYSIQKHASFPVEVKALDRALADKGIELPLPRQPALRARTPFSFQRFAIPELAGFSGRAIYLDSDMLVFRDIVELWEAQMPVPLRAVKPRPRRLRKPQLSVMLLDCARLKHWRVGALVERLDRGDISYAAIMDGSGLGNPIAQDLPSAWNDLEFYCAKDTALLHYTDMSRQPWLSSSNRYAEVWCRTLLEAIDAGFIPRDEVHRQVELGWVRPSLAYQVDRRIADPRRLPKTHRLADLTCFVPPHRRARRKISGDTQGGRIGATLRLVANDWGLASLTTQLAHVTRLGLAYVRAGQR